MTETQESIRQDSSKRGIEKKGKDDWSGRRHVLPRGTTLPATGIDGEMFVKIDESGTNKLCTFDEYLDHWVTVGPTV